MARTNDTSDDLPTHVNDTVQDMASLHEKHHRQQSLLQGAVEGLTAALGQPVTICILGASVVAWLIVNGVQAQVGRPTLDAPPFGWLTLALTLTSFFVVLLVLSTQRREGRLAQLREQLTLQLAILNDQKSAKIIELLEAVRRDSPHLESRHDHEAGAMAKPADPHSVARAIRDTHAEAEKLDS